MVAGGMESMTSPPSTPPKSRTGIKYGTASLLDHMAADGLWDVYTDQSMGALTDAGNCGEVQVSRADQDAFAARSHQRAAAATASGVMAEELVEVKVPQRRGPDRLVATDEGIREGVTAESLAGLPPAFALTGRSPPHRRARSDGAAALIVASAEAAERLGVAPLAEVRPAAWWRARLLPAAAAGRGHPGRLLQGADRDPRPGPDRDQRGFRRSRRGQCPRPGAERVRDRREGQHQRRGDRPRASIGASGARLVLTLAYALRRRGGGTGVASLCGGGGQGDALILRSL